MPGFDPHPHTGRPGDYPVQQRSQEKGDSIAIARATSLQKIHTTSGSESKNAFSLQFQTPALNRSQRQRNQSNSNMFPPSVGSIEYGSNSSEHPYDDSTAEIASARPRAICSVLNAVIDHVMVPPSPVLELEEWEWNEEQQQHEEQQNRSMQAIRDHDAAKTNTGSNQLQVPVLRIFGPIVRRDTNLQRHRAVLDPPSQSACLYIHGAFPYMLARPVVAGPDGGLSSIHRRLSSSNKGRVADPDDDIDDDMPQHQHVDWDSREAVERMLPVLHEHLEASIQDSMNADPFSNHNNKAEQHGASAGPKLTQTKVVRCLSVVMGRGFYTYCPGPPAPFLRIEYYRPSDRWRVKRALERGLADLPSYYHADPTQYDYHGDSSAADAQRQDQPLQFHCYEAHIPYTMQFFKDWNLAGMSYIHVSHALFRDPLPQLSPASSIAATSGTGKPAEKVETLFLRSNTPELYRWECVRLPIDSIAGEDDIRCSPDWVNTNGSLFQSQRACSDQSLEEPTHAMSLVVEGKTMEHTPFTPPRKDTSCQVELDISVDWILNVLDVIRDVPSDDDQRHAMHWRAVPSLREIWREERRRMAKLLPPAEDFLSGGSQGPKAAPAFTLNVKHDAGLPGTRLAREGMQRLVQVTEGLEGNFRRAVKDIVERHGSKVDEVDAAFLAARKVKANSRDYETPCRKETIQANSPHLQNKDETPSHDETLEALGSLAEKDSISTKEYSPKSLSLSTTLTPTHVDALDALGELVNAFENTAPPAVPPVEAQCPSLEIQSTYGMEVQQASPCDAQGTPNSSRACSQLVDRRLSTNERFCALSQAYYDLRGIDGSATADGFELSQRVERGDAVINGPVEYIEDFIDPETLTPFQDAEDDELDSEDEEMDESRFETMMSTLATQTFRAEAGPMGARLSYEHDDVGCVAFHRDDPAIHDTDSESIESLVLLHEGETEQAVDRIGVTGSAKTPNTGSTYPPIASFEEWHHCSDVWIQLRESAPTRGRALKTADETGLHPMPYSGDTAPRWLKHVHAYEFLRRDLKLKNDWKPPLRSCLTLCRHVLNRHDVISWLQSEKKRRNDGTDARVGKLLRQASDACDPQIRIDGNARKLVAMSTGPVCNPFGRGEVEEVEWLLSQQPILPRSEEIPGSKDLMASRPNNPILSEVVESTCSKTSEMVSDAVNEEVKGFSSASTAATDESLTFTTAVEGMGNQGGRLVVEKGGQLKAKTRPSQLTNARGREIDAEISHPIADDLQYLPTPVSIMSIEVHVQCRTGRGSVSDARVIAMTPVSDRDKVYAVVYIFARDPGGGESLTAVERGCLVVPVDMEIDRAGEGCDIGSTLERLAIALRNSMPRNILGIESPSTVEYVRDERQLLLRFASIVRLKDPDMLISWDTQSSGLGYLIERGDAISNGEKSDSAGRPGTEAPGIDMARLLGRTPTVATKSPSEKPSLLRNLESEKREDPNSPQSESKGATRWKGSGLGSDWDDRVGAGVAAASIVGRLVFAAWKLVAEEVKHPNASYLPAMVSAVLSRRIPHFDNIKLTQWYGHDRARDRWRVIHHRMVQACSSLMLFDALDMIGRSGEAARLSGVEFSQSFPGIRGSQYKVEGVLLRALQSLNSSDRGSKLGRAQKRKTQGPWSSSCLSDESKSQTQSPWKARRGAFVNAADDDDALDGHDLSDRCYFFYSPSLQDTNRQEALEVQALTLEPQSGHQQDPVVVCDFTALYPSLVIAYNLCYSTCAGRLEYHSTRQEMRREGVTTGNLGPFRYPEGRTATVLKHHMKSISNHSERGDRIYVAPTGTIYVAESVLRGVLPQVLDEMLSTRAMLKKASKQYKKLVPGLAPSILRQLEARQLALKYVANVTYGYTSATFSGRCAMPLLADTIVECGRRTLTNAINLANQWGRQINGKWYGCQVIYGDTDSLFIKLPGRSVHEAFLFGEELCRAVTTSNPPPVQLKLEKVYRGSIMQTKKKYCGMKFEAKDQRKPAFEAKGLEIVRRDQCVLTQKILKNCLITLFRSGIEAVKSYLFRQWSLILSGQLPVSDYILTGRIRSRYRGGKPGPVQASLARRIQEGDPGRVFLHNERLAFVIVATPGTNFRLKDCVLTPMELMEQWDAYTIHTGYYITRHVNPAVQRCLGLAPHKINGGEWYDSCPKPRRRIHFWPITKIGGNLMISSYFGSDTCALCGIKCTSQGKSRASVCSDCKRDDLSATTAAMSRLRIVQQNALSLGRKCSVCNLCYEDGSTYAQIRFGTRQKGQSAASVETTSVAIPLANCSCIDCPTTFDRHRAREMEIEISAVCEALELL